MKLEEAINGCLPHQYLSRKKWREHDLMGIKLITSKKSLKELHDNIVLTTESVNADDWEIWDIVDIKGNGGSSA